MKQEGQEAQIGKLAEPLRIAEVFQIAEARAAREPEKLITFVNGMQSFHGYRGELTIVLCRELKRSVEIASAVALKLALKFPERNVLLFNTYASAELLTSGFVQALHLLDIKVPYIFQRYLPKASAADFSDTVDLPSPENLRVIDCPTSTLTPETLARDIERTGAEIVILNSLEYAGFSDRRRREIARGLLDLRHRTGVSIFIFSHEMRRLLPYMGGRGTLGMLSAFTKSVWPILNEWERSAWVQRLYSELDQLGN